MPAVDVNCPHCSSYSKIMRNGISQSGHLRYLCSLCNRTFQLRSNQKASEPNTRHKIIDMAMNRVGRRATARIMGISFNTVL